jgi:hypothetical protein
MLLALALLQWLTAAAVRVQQQHHAALVLLHAPACQLQSLLKPKVPLLELQASVPAAATCKCMHVFGKKWNGGRGGEAQ